MATIDIQGFAAAAGALALKIESAHLPGLLSKRLVVPAGCVALIRDEDGREELLRAGGEATGRFVGVLAKEGELAVPFEVHSLPTREGMLTTAGVELVLSVPPRAIELAELREALLRDRERVEAGDLRAYLLPALRTALALFLSTKSADEIATEDPRPELDRRVEAELKGPCFAAGLDLREVRHPSFYCDEYEKARRRRLEARAAEEEMAARERLQAYAARLERNEVLKKQEVEELAKVLQYQGVLKELSLKSELDRKRKEEEIRRFEDLHRKLGNDDVKALIFLLEDERLKADLIERLIERDMTEEQIRARKVADVEKKLEAKIAELSARLAEISGARAAKLAAQGMRTRRVFGVLGKQVLAYDPAPGARRDVPREVYDQERGPLGWLRSVRTVVTRDGTMICAGAQRGVYAIREQDPRDERQLRFPRDPAGQGGVNAVAYFDGHYYASHSELGIWRWDALLFGRPEQLFEGVTGRNESTRGVSVSPDGKLYFASGPDVWRADLVRPAAEVVRFRGGEDAITSFALSRDEVFAGTRGGRILRWSLSDPASPRELPVRKAEAIYMVKVAELGGDPHLLVGAKEHGVTAVSIEDGRTFDFRAKDQIRWVDGASDFVFGVSRCGYTIHVFDAARTVEEAFTIRVAERLQDIWVEKERAPASA
jgi:hypothetical protein